MALRRARLADCDEIADAIRMTACPEDALFAVLVRLRQPSAYFAAAPSRRKAAA